MWTSQFGATIPICDVNVRRHKIMKVTPLPSQCERTVSFYFSKVSDSLPQIERVYKLIRNFENAQNYLFGIKLLWFLTRYSSVSKGTELRSTSLSPLVLFKNGGEAFKISGQARVAVFGQVQMLVFDSFTVNLFHLKSLKLIVAFLWHLFLEKKPNKFDSIDISIVIVLNLQRAQNVITSRILQAGWQIFTSHYKCKTFQTPI